MWLVGVTAVLRPANEAQRPLNVSGEEQKSVGFLFSTGEPSSAGADGGKVDGSVLSLISVPPSKVFARPVCIFLLLRRRTSLPSYALLSPSRYLSARDLFRTQTVRGISVSLRGPSY